MIQGGWEYVWSSYVVTWVGLALYALSLLWRRRDVDADTRPAADEDSP